LIFPAPEYYYITVLTAVADNIEEVRRRIALAAGRAGREPSAVRLVAVSKTVSAGGVREAYDAGLRIFGESRVQEALEKAGELRGLDVEWHMIGHLQKNKAKAAAGLFEVIHSVDSGELMEIVDRNAGRLGKVQRIMIQLKLAPGDVAKHGAGEGELGELLRRGERLDNVSVEGLMTIPPLYDDTERARPLYRRLRELADEFGLRELSMGMTGDFEVAVEEGATMVRVGSAIFGEREY
jgi:hypothetical protein